MGQERELVYIKPFRLFFPHILSFDPLSHPLRTVTQVFPDEEAAAQRSGCSLRSWMKPERV